MNHQKPILQKFPAPAGFSVAGENLKRSPSELALEALLNDDASNNNHNRSSAPAIRDSGADVFFGNYHHEADDDIAFGFKNQDIMNGFSTCGGLGESPSWYQNFTPQQPSVSVTIDSQSSICAGSPTSTLKPKAGDNQGSGSSDDEDETEAGAYKEGNGQVDVKRIRRMESNKESARRSRKRKQAHLQKLEEEVEQLSGESVTLYKQLNEATRQLRDATTNNRVLKSDVEALRAKVKLAEDMVTRGSLSCSLNHLIQTHLGSPQMLNTQSLSGVSNISPAITIQGQDTSFGGAFSGQNPGIPNNNVNHVLNGNARSGVVSDAVSPVSEMWP